MTPTRSRPLTIVADDLTGACDAGAFFTARASVPVTIWPRRAIGDVAVRVVDTETRRLPAEDAAERVATVGTVGRAGRYFKKIDSTLRGPLGAELDALLRATGTTTAIVCPAFPAQGRVVLDRLCLVNGVPVAETPTGRNPLFPVLSSSVVETLRPQCDRALSWIPIDQLRAGLESLAARIGRLAGTVIVADAETDADLDALVEAALVVVPTPLLAGSAGLARALAARLGLLGERVELPTGPRWLLVAGSTQPATRRQIKEARAAGLTVMATPERRVADANDALSRLAAQAAAAIDKERWDLVAVTGGETAVALWTTLGADRLDLLGVPAPGLALGQLRVRGREPLTVLTKAGGFGPPDLFAALQKEAVA